MKRCPTCNSSNESREIPNVAPDGPVDDQKNLIGDCYVAGNDLRLKCAKCGWIDENLNNATGLGGEIRTVKLQDISKMSDSEIDSYARQIWQKLAKPSKRSASGSSKR